MTSRRARGQAMVEFALTAWLLVLLVVCLFDVARAAMIAMSLNNAAQDAARYLSLPANRAQIPGSTGALCSNGLSSVVTIFGADGCLVTVTASSQSAAPLHTVTVQLKYAFQFTLSPAALGGFQLSGSSSTSYL